MEARIFNEWVNKCNFSKFTILLPFCYTLYKKSRNIDWILLNSKSIELRCYLHNEKQLQKSAVFAHLNTPLQVSQQLHLTEGPQQDWHNTDNWVLELTKYIKRRCTVEQGSLETWVNSANKVLGIQPQNLNKLSWLHMLVHSTLQQCLSIDALSRTGHASDPQPGKRLCIIECCKTRSIILKLNVLFLSMREFKQHICSRAPMSLPGLFQCSLEPFFYPAFFSSQYYS